MARRWKPIGRVRIVQPPFGEAPSWVREAWVGLELPFIYPPRAYLTAGGVVTGPKTFLGQLWEALRGKANRVVGYPVYSAEAIALLAIANPDAANWWRVNTPRFLNPRQIFLFDEPACILVQSPDAPPHGARA